ncbi:hypothetical protein FAES_0407 [Fibrella aestuarina BUZ 2]|uniref:Uncharacterized protein n=1 Tax=Fibrella aestuarina BUZ 2 TaxID=1166018 RepID=I0K2R6_9BACT|nr:hypothetical protein FAES_0407 [Fibrella aestuarina BUZ 2]
MLEIHFAVVLNAIINLMPVSRVGNGGHGGLGTLSASLVN